MRQPARPRRPSSPSPSSSSPARGGRTTGRPSREPAQTEETSDGGEDGTVEREGGDGPSADTAGSDRELAPRADPGPVPLASARSGAVSSGQPAPDAADVFGSREANVSSGFQERLEERRRARRHALVTRALLAAGAVTVVAGAVWTIFFSPLLALEADRITVTGTDDSALAAEVSEAAAPWIGVPLPRLDGGELASAVEEIAGVRTATVSRDWPDGVSIEIEPRVERLAVASESGFDLVDSEGVTVRHLDAIPEGVVEAALPDDATERAEAAADAVAVIDGLDESVRDQLETVESDTTTVRLHLSGDREVIWGDTEDGELKNEVLVLLLEQREASVYDVSDPTRPLTS